VIGKYADDAYKSEMTKLIDAIEAVPVTSRVSQRYLTGLKMLWNESSKIAVSLLFSYFFEKNQDPHFSDDRKRLNFQIVSNRVAETESKQIIKVDLKCDASRLFVFFNDGQYKSWLVVAPKYGEKSKSDSFVKFFEPSYSEEEFIQILQSGIPLSFTMEIPKSESKIRLLVFNPIMSIYGIKEVEVQR
jgi:hypothetical protein